MNDSLVKADLSAESLVGQVADEFLRQEAGERPDVEEYAARHPEAAELLRKVLTSLQALDASLTRGEFASPDDAGTGTLGDFRLLREVGRGGMGIVYEAEQINLGRRVALKVLPFAATMDPRQLQRFHNEARAAAQLHHNHIVPIYWVGQDRGLHYYAMQYIDGQNLAAVIQGLRLHGATGEPTAVDGGAEGAAETRPVAARTTEHSFLGREHFQTAARLVVQAAEALDYAHQVGIVHRDVKPANLILDGKGDLWLTDFGLARLPNDLNLTTSGDLIGTLRYMSPEQATAKRLIIDHRTDVYSLGATLYELLTLQPAAPGDEREEVLNRIVFEEPRPPRRINKAIPAELETIVLKALDKDPAARYGTAQELAHDLRRFLANQPVRARRPTVVRRITKWATRHRAVVTTVAGCLLLGVVAALAGLLWHNDRLRVEVEKTAQEREAALEEQRWAAKAVDDTYTRVATDWLGPKPRLQPLQREFLEKALEYYQHAAERWTDVPGLRWKVSEAHLRVGNINAALGRHARAEEAFRLAIAGFEELRATSPGDQEVLYNLLSSSSGLAQTLQATGRLSEAAEAYRRNLDLTVKLVADFPESTVYKSQLATAKSNLAFVLADAGRTEEAERLYRESLAAFDRLPLEVRDHKDVRSGLANTRNNLGKLYNGVNRSADAEPLLRQAVAELERLTSEFRTNTDYREQLAFTLSNHGVALNQLGRAADARLVLTRAESAMEQLAVDFPDLSNLPSELAGIQINLGVVLRKLGEVGEAERFYRKAIRTLGDLAAREPDVVGHRERLCAAQSNLGRLLRDAGRSPDAEKAFHEALQTHESLAGKFPGIRAYQASLAECLFGLGNTLTRSGKFPSADEAYTRALGLQEKLLAGEPANGDYRRAVTSTCNTLALLLVWAQDPPYPGANRAVKLGKRAVELDPGGGTRWRTLGLAEFRVGNWSGCLKALQRAAELGPENKADHFFQAMAHWHLGEKEEARRHYDAAAQWLGQQANPDRKGLRLRDEAAALLGLPGGEKREQARPLTLTDPG